MVPWSPFRNAVALAIFEPTDALPKPEAVALLFKCPVVPLADANVVAEPLTLSMMPT